MHLFQDIGSALIAFDISVIGDAGSLAIDILAAIGRAAFGS